jgi:hypothetical protein
MEYVGPDADNGEDFYRMLELPERGAPYSPDEVVFMDFGACKGKSPKLFDTNTAKGKTSLRGSVTIGKQTISKLAAIEVAKSICATCEVSGECREFIENYPEKEGVWAGTLPEERGQA